MKRWRRLLLIAGAAIFVLVAICAVAVTLALRSEWFQDKFRARIVAEVEKATGGRASIGSFQVNWGLMRGQVNDFVLRGTEPESHPPLFRADSVVVGLKLISALRRDIDIALLEIDGPQVSIEQDENGKTNLPAPRIRREKSDLIEPFLKLAIGRIEITHGVVRYASRELRGQVSGNDLQVRAFYEAAAPLYRGDVQVKQLRIAAPERVPVVFDADAEWSLEQQRFRLARAHLRLPKSSAELSGVVEDFTSPRAVFDVKAQVAVEEVVKPAKLPILPVGNAQFSGTVTYSRGSYLAAGSLSASGLAVQQDRVNVGPINMTAKMEVAPANVTFKALEVRALDGRFSGEAAIHRFDRFSARGNVSNLQILNVARAVQVRNVPWNGLISGPVEIQGKLRQPGAPGVVASGRVTIQPAEEGKPIAGTVEAKFEQDDNKVVFGTSQLETQSSSIVFSGPLRERLQVEITTADPAELLPALAMVKESGVPESLPVELSKGSTVRFQGTVLTPLGEPRIQGTVSVGPFVYDHYAFEYLAAGISADSTQLAMRDLSLRQNGALLRGRAEVALSDWQVKDSSNVGGELSLTGLSLADLIKTSGQDIPVTGALSGAAKLSGTRSSPQALVLVRVDKLAAYNEQFDSLDAEMRYANHALEISAGKMQAGAGSIGFSGSYKHSAEDWKTGQLQFETSGRTVTLGQWKAIQNARAGLDANLQWQFNGAVQLQTGRPRLTSLTGELHLDDLALNERKLGGADLIATTRRNLLIVIGKAGLVDASLHLNAEWTLERNSFGLGSIQFNGLTLGGLRDVGLLGSPGSEMANGVFDGDLAFSGPVLRPDTWEGMARITRMEVSPELGGIAKRKRNLTIRNEEPMRFALSRNGMSIETARLVSEDTDLEASGTLSFARKNPWDLRLTGSMNLAVLNVLNADLLAQGKSSVDVSLRGSLLEPQLNGRLQFENASFNLEDIPNGLENARGTILFDRNRATIENFSSQSGGGNLAVSGFVGFGQELVYRLQAKASEVRVRYPEGVSTVLNAQLEFTGSSRRTLLSGDVTVSRASFLPSTDIGGLLSQTARPEQPGAITNPFLRGMQFDVRVRTSGSGVFQTSLTRDIELEADLRLGGGPAKPVVLGSVNINEGEILFFGNRYTIVQGEVTFFNPTKIEPVVAMDLETRVRGYTVTINFSGPLNKLNFSYRSDPPLQSQEILALLTVGRAPESVRTTATQSQSAQNVFQAGGNSLLGQALATPVSSRLQRLFGVSRIKIDPQLTGVDNTPETLVTVEQQLSREITLTYVTNLTHTQQQIVRIEWKFNKDWSVYAVRDSNGIFGVDFVYQRRF